MWFRPWEGLTIKAALVLGFGTTVGLWLLAGYQLADRIRVVQSETTAVNQRYNQAQERLSTVRAQVLLGSVYVRDALLDPDPASLSRYRENFVNSYNVASRALREYVPLVDGDARSHLALRQKIEEFRQASLDVLAGDRTSWSTNARVLLNRDIGPRREAVVRLSDDIQSLNRVTFIRQQADVATLYAGVHRRVWERLGLAFAGSLCIALLATMYVVHLERDLRRRRAQEARTTEELQRLSARLVSAQEEERRTIARELHDEVGQVLMAIKFELAVAQRAIEASGGSRRLLDDAQEIADGAINTVRDLSRLLHPSVLDDLGLAAAIDWYLEALGKRHDLRVQLVPEGMDQRLAPEIESAAFRIVQEALTNVVRHAQAASCYVYLGRVDDRLHIVVQDDGIGFDAEGRPSDQKRRGLGLIGIRERASHLGGTARVEAAPGRGTRLIVNLPGRVRPAVDVDEPNTASDLGNLPNLEAIRG